MGKKNYPDYTYLYRLAIKAGGIITKNFGKVKNKTKKDGTPLTIVDTAINELVVSSISRDFPHVSIIAEEGNYEVNNAEYRVFCDPLDGTIPFCLGIPISTFCISVLKDNAPLIAFIFDPFCNRIWHAIKGEGSFLNGKRVKVSQCGQISGSNLCMIWWRNSRYNLSAVCAKIMEAKGNWMNPSTIAIFGGLVASGNLDATIFPAQKGWETAAMQVIIEEAGGKVTDIFGKKLSYGPKGEIKGHITSNGLIHDELVALVQSCQ